MDYRQKILSLVQSAPVLPTQVGKALGIDSLMSGAMLSEMVSKGLIRVSRFKVGGSPLYFAPSHPEHLCDFITNLNEKDQRTVRLLEEKGVLRDQGQDPLVRVGLQQLRDFAIPLMVQYGEKEELFYKWFLLSEDAAREKIRELIDPQETKPAPKIDATNTQQEERPESTKPEESSDPALPREVESSQRQVRGASRPVQNRSSKDSDILAQAESFFVDNNIAIVQKDVLKKNDIDFMLALPSPVGPLRYFCKVRGKKRIADADLSNAYVQGQLKKLPVLFLTSGELSKSARELLPKLKGVVVKQL